MKSAETWCYDIMTAQRSNQIEHIVKRIQADALAHAGQTCLEVAQRRVNDDAADCAKAILAEANKLEI